MNAFVKLGIGAILLGVGFVVSMQAQRELIAKWATPCEECDDETSVVDIVKATVETTTIPDDEPFESGEQ